MYRIVWSGGGGWAQEIGEERSWEPLRCETILGEKWGKEKFKKWCCELWIVSPLLVFEKCKKGKDSDHA